MKTKMLLAADLGPGRPWLALLHMADSRLETYLAGVFVQPTPRPLASLPAPPPILRRVCPPVLTPCLAAAWHSGQMPCLQGSGTTATRA